MTELDKSLAIAQRNTAQIDQFYNTFLNTVLFIPTADLPQGVASRRATENDTFSPIIVEHEGISFMLAFDLLDRLEAWTNREIDYISMPAHALVEAIDMMDQEVHLALNVGTKYLKEFSAEELAWLFGTIQANRSQVTTPKGTNVSVKTPTKLDQDLDKVLQASLANNSEIHVAYLVELHVQDRSPSLFLVLKLDKDTEEYFQAISNDIGTALRGYLSGSLSLDIALYTGQGLTEIIAKKSIPFYVRTE